MTQTIAQTGTDTAEDHILLEKAGCAGRIVLNRPQALNALTNAMRAAIAPRLQVWARDPEIYGIVIEAAGGRAFCAGGDVRELYDLGRTDRAAALAGLAEEYRLNWQLDRFCKPTVSLINGAVMGSGVGLSIFGTHKVAGEGYGFAMPEVRIGFFPDVGATWFLSRLPDGVGLYLGLTGQRIGAADAYHLGLVTHCIPSDRFGEIRAAMQEADPIDPVLDGLHEEPGESDLAPVRDTIARCFSASSMEDILARLEAERGAAASWAEETLAQLRAASPTSLKVTFRQLTQGPTMSLREALACEYRLATRFLSAHDFYEGVRARLIDKDNSPAWQPDSLAEVSDAAASAYFAPLEEGGLDLPPDPPIPSFTD